MHKVLHQVVDVSVPDSYFTPVSLNTRGHQSRLIQLQTNVDSYLRVRVRLTLNTLPNHVIEANTFKAICQTS